MRLMIVGKVIDAVSDVGFGVIKNSGKMIWGGGQAVVGVVTDTDELVEQGTKNLVRGGVGVATSVGLGKLFPKDSEGDGEDSC